MSDTTIVNRDELAQALRCSLPTVSALVKRWPDFPVIERGALGSALAYVLLSVALSIGALALGLGFARALTGAAA